MLYKNRKSIRLKHYDYSKAGLYFVTICANHRQSIFGNIDNDIMLLNDAGLMIEKWYFELENKFDNIKCHEMVVMPNHFHCIIEITVGADLSVCPPHASKNATNQNQKGRHAQKGRHIGLPLHEVVQWFKTMTTNEYIRGVKNCNWEPFNKKMWQRNYYEHIIRNEKSYIKLLEYIENNPRKWEIDTLYPDNMETNNVK